MAAAKKYHRSVSQFKTYSRCGEIYRIQRFMKELPRSPSAALALGTAVHSVYSDWEAEERSFPMIERFSGYYEIAIDALKEEQPDLKYWTKAPQIKEVQKDIEVREQNGLLMCETFEEHCRSSDWVPLVVDGRPGTELQFEVDIGDVPVRGAIDLVKAWPSGNITVEDVKTGNREDSGFQLGTYRYALKHVFDISVTWGEYYYTKDGKSVAYNLSKYTDAYLEDQFAGLNKGINEKIFLVNPGKHCEMCFVKKHCREMGDN